VERPTASTGLPPGRVGQPTSSGDSWEKVADWYDALASERGTEFQQQVVIPGLLRLLEVRPGDMVCDLACGQGAVTQAIARAGAQVTGVDLSPRLVEIAKRRSEEGAAPGVSKGAALRFPKGAAQKVPTGAGQRLSKGAALRSPKGIRYLVADARHVPELKSGSFDAVTCVLAAMNMDPVEPLFAEMSRLLRPMSPLPAGAGARDAGAGEGEGKSRPGAMGASRASAPARAVIVILHPAFRIPRQSRWNWDEGRKLLTREVDRYLSPLSVPIDMRPFNRPGEAMTTTYHRPVGAYVNGLAQAGLLVDRFEEWPSHRTSQRGPRAKAEDRARDEFPLFLAIRAVKA
jgi:ubiquinone/menaquinone biosynthesis C-methylase UbiE